MSNSTVFVITDVVPVGRFNYETGFWTGSELTDDQFAAKRYETLKEAKDVVINGDFYDPMIREIRIVTEIVHTYDMYKHGRVNKNTNDCEGP